MTVPDSRNRDELEGRLYASASVHDLLHVLYLRTSMQIWANLTTPLILRCGWRRMAFARFENHPTAKKVRTNVY
jgi:hypothetical protein